MHGVDINWLRWLVFGLIGVPAFLWLFMTRDRPLRVLAVVAIIVFIQDVFVWRRHLVAIGIGPSLMFGYVGVMALYFQRGRFASLGTAGPLWVLFLAAAFMAAIIGSLGNGLIFLNVNQFQEFYLEGLLFFILGMMALDDDQEVLRFFFLFVAVVAFGVALFHLFELVSGWRPANFVLAAAKGKSGRLATPGAVFPNPNTLGAFYVMSLPMALLMVLRGGFTGWRRILLVAATVAISISLLLTSARGGIILTTGMSGVALVLAGFSIGRVLGAGIGVGLLLGLAWFVATLILPEFLSRITGQLEEEGLRTGRYNTWWTFFMMSLDHPMGVGLLPDNVKPIHKAYGTTLTSAHNTYLDTALRMGFLGLFAFLALLGHIVMRILTAMRVSRMEPERYRGLVYALLAIIGFLMAGIVEPNYTNGSKLNQTLWILCGIGYAASARILGEVASEAVARRRSGWQLSEPSLEHG